VGFKLDIVVFVDRKWHMSREQALDHILLYNLIHQKT
jgi:hypothetical protein